jgi:hypothetical protein
VPFVELATCTHVNAEPEFEIDETVWLEPFFIATNAKSRRLEPPVVMLVVAVVPPLVGVTKSPSAACVEPNLTDVVALERAPEAGHVPVSQKWSPMMLIVAPTAPEAGVFETARGRTLKPV